ncbi:MAG TPA: hypothetical protein VF820_03625, partial [Patescibacteria group bacterium]
MKKIVCFICGEDITKTIKVLSYHNYPDAMWDKFKQDWTKDFKKLSINGMMCQNCAKKDLEIAHARVTGKDKEYEEQIREEGRQEILS